MSNTKIVAYLLPPEWQQNYLHTWCDRAAALTVVSPGMLSPRVESISILCRVTDFRFTKRDARIVSGWDFDRLIPCHGEVVETGGKKMWNDQYAWYLEQDHKAWMFFVFRTGFCLFNGCTGARCLVPLDCNYTIRVGLSKVVIATTFAYLIPILRRASAVLLGFIIYHFYSNMGAYLQAWLTSW